MTTSTPSRSASSNSRMARSASSRYLMALLGVNSATSERCAASSAAYPSCRCAMPGIMSSYRSCMIPRIPMRGLRPTQALMTSPYLRSTLAIVVLVAGVQRVHLVRGQRRRLAVGTGQMHRPRRVLAHHGGLDRVPRGAADGEHAVAAHQHGGGAVPGQRGHHPAADLVAADQRERAD